ncbi:MAG: class I SAM-dependent methyltransferase [Ginsengibacter sp.]
MKTEQIRDLAIKRHNIDANHFQDTYRGLNNSRKSKVFLYGRNMVLEELDALLKKIPVGSKILDIGCGTAHLTNWIKEKGFQVYGLEPSKNMYNYAIQNFPDIEIKKGISSELPYPENFFDMIVAFEVLRYLDKSENIATYKEIYRVLKPKGCFFVTQVNLFSTDFYFIFHKLKGAYCNFLNKTHHHCNFTTPSMQEKIVKKVGFSDVTTIGRMSGSIRFFYKFGNRVGDLYRKFFSKITKQRFTKASNKVFAGHLLVVGTK